MTLRVPDDQPIGSPLGGLGVSGSEFWIVDEGGQVFAKAKCRPFLVAEGFNVEVPTPVRPRGRIPKRPGFLSGLGAEPKVVVSTPDDARLDTGVEVNDLFGLG